MAQASKQVPPAGSGTNKTTDFFTSPKDGTVQSVSYDPSSTITGSNQNTRVIGLVNLGPASNPKYTPIATLPLTSGVVLTGGQANTIPLTSTTTIETGDRIIWASVANGDGVADPGGEVTVNYQLT
jgi:hypothetical protein